MAPRLRKKKKAQRKAICRGASPSPSHSWTEKPSQVVHYKHH